MNGLLVIAWLVFPYNGNIAIPYDSLEKCRAVAISIKMKMARPPFCVQGNGTEHPASHWSVK